MKCIGPGAAHLAHHGPGNVAVLRAEIMSQQPVFEDGVHTQHIVGYAPLTSTAPGCIIHDRAVEEVQSGIHPAGIDG